MFAGAFIEIINSIDPKALTSTLLVINCALFIVALFFIRKRWNTSKNPHTTTHGRERLSLLDVALLGYHITIIRKKNNKKSKEYHIALLAPELNPNIDIIQKGFTDTLENELPCKVNIQKYNAQGDKWILASSLKHIQHNNFDLAFSIGAWCTQLLCDELRLTNNSNRTPIIYCDIERHALEHFSTTPNKSNSTGVLVSTHDYTYQMSLILSLQPELKNVLISNGPTRHSIPSDVQNQTRTVEKYLRRKGVGTKTISINSSRELVYKIIPHLDKYELLLLMKDHSLISALHEIVPLCNRFKTTLVTSDLDSFHHGAALSFGHEGYPIGSECGLYAKKILIDDVHPSQIPVRKVNINNKLLINSRLCKRQGFIIRNDLLKLVKNCAIV